MTTLVTRGQERHGGLLCVRLGRQVYTPCTMCQSHQPHKQDSGLFGSQFHKQCIPWGEAPSFTCILNLVSVVTDCYHSNSHHSDKASLWCGQYITTFRDGSDLFLCILMILCGRYRAFVPIHFLKTRITTT